MRFLWATRGRTWGFRVLVTGGLVDPLTTYEDTFADVGDEAEVWQRKGTAGALRFPDPLGRRDRSGRVVPHDFVVLEPDAAVITTVDEGRHLLWPEVVDIFADTYSSPAPPAPRS